MTNLFGDVSSVHDNLEDELLEPVGGHKYVALLAPVLAPGVLHSPPGHTPVLLQMAPRKNLNK